MKDMPTNGYVASRALKFQVGFLLAEGKGHASDSELDFPRVQVADDLILEHLRGTLRFSRTSEGILVQGQLETVLPVACDRCLQEFSLTLHFEVEELYIYPPRPEAEFVVHETGILDFAPLLREEIFTETPMMVLCRPDCAGLCPECGQNLNEAQCACSKQQTDVRLQALQQLKERLED